MIDLHVHTTYSDGADSLIEVLKKAEELKKEHPHRDISIEVLV